jgi:hypothetical protein
MADVSILDKALGLISSVQDARKEGRDELMRTILPEILQPEELKQAAAPMKEEASKTLHAPKYDRRMKFNTALERSGHKATSEEPVKAKEDPAWLKEAASLEELQRRQAVNLIMMEYLNNPNASTRKSDGTSVIDLQQLPEESQAQVQKAFKGLRFAPKRAFDTSSFDGSGITGREGVITVEDELLKTPPLPTEDPPEYDVGNKPVMQKASAAMTAAHPSLAEPFSLAEPSGWEKAGPAIGGTLMGITLPAMGLVDSQITPKGLGILGLGGLGLGLGTYGLLRRSQRKHREKAQEFVNNLNQIAALPKTASDLYSKVARSSYIMNNLDHLKQYGPDVLDATQSIAESKEQDILEAGIHKAYHRIRDQHEKEAADPSSISSYPEESFTQRHPAVLPIGLGLLGATVGAVPGAFLGGRAAVRSATKAYQRNLDDVGEAYQRAMNTYNRADNSTPQIVIEKIKENLRNTRNAYRKVKESPPEPGYHRALGQVGGGLLGGLTGGGLGTLGGLELNKPQPWE